MRHERCPGCGHRVVAVIPFVIPTVRCEEKRAAWDAAPPGAARTVALVLWPGAAILAIIGIVPGTIVLGALGVEPREALRILVAGAVALSLAGAAMWAVFRHLARRAAPASHRFWLCRWCERTFAMSPARRN
jgi:hypothetical protein